MSLVSCRFVMEGILDRLFESTPKARLMKLFLMNPDKEFLLPEIVKQTQLKRRVVGKELAKFLKLGLVKTRVVKTSMARKIKQKKTKKIKSKPVKVRKTAKTAGPKNAAKIKGRKRGKKK